MRKKVVLCLLVSCLALFASCAGQGASPERPEGPDQTGEAEKTNESEGEAEKETGKETEPEKETAAASGETQQTMNQEIYEKVPYRLYPTSENAWVGDVMPMAEGDTLHLFYLYDTDHNGPGYHPIHKFSTENLYEYRDEGLAVNYGGSPEDPDRAIGTGSVLKGQDGRYHCFYTGHNDSFPEKGLDRECVMHAVSEDNITWTKIPEDTFYAPEAYSGDDFRDPFVFWNQEEECYWLLIAARDQELGGIVARYTSKDLAEWTLCDPLYAPGKQYMLECPDLFRMGDWYYLFYSWDMVTYYAMSRSPLGPFEEPQDNVLDGTGFCFYAAKTAEVNGTRYLCGWIGRKSEEKDTGTYSWAGSLLIHQLVQKEDGTLGVREPESFRDYFAHREEIAVAGTAGNVEELSEGYRLTAEKDQVSLVQFGMRKPTMMLEFTISFSGPGFGGVAFGEEEDYDRYTGIVLDAVDQCVHYEGCVLSRLRYGEPLVTTAFSFEPGKEYRIKVVMENEITVVYVDDTKALSSRGYRFEGADWGLYVNGTEAVIKDIAVYTP